MDDPDRLADLRVGSLFLKRDTQSDNKHFCFVLSDPIEYPSEIIVVNMTGWKPGRGPRDRFADPACMLYVGDHPQVTKLSCIYYAGAEILTIGQIEAKYNLGTLDFREPASQELMQRIIAGASDTYHLQDDIYYAMVEQKIIEL